MLYRLSYASGGSKSFQAQYFPDPFLIVRDNYLRYHKGYRPATGTSEVSGAVSTIDDSYQGIASAMPQHSDRRAT